MNLRPIISEEDRAINIRMHACMGYMAPVYASIKAERKAKRLADKAKRRQAWDAYHDRQDIARIGADADRAASRIAQSSIGEVV